MSYRISRAACCVLCLPRNPYWDEYIKWSYDLRSYECNFYNCVEKPEKFRTSTGFEPVTSRYRCDALTNWAMKPLMLGAGHLWALMFPWGMNQWWNDIWNGSYMNCGYEIKWGCDPRSYERNFCNCEEKPEKFRTTTGFEPVTSRFHIRSSIYDSFQTCISFHRWFIHHGNVRPKILFYSDK